MVHKIKCHSCSFVVVSRFFEMATFFGEVIEPSCRTLWGNDSDEEDICDVKRPTFTSSILDESAFVSKYKFMVIAHDKKMTGFIKSCFLTDTTSIIASFSQEKGDDDDSKQQKDDISVLYKVTNDVVLFAASPYITERNAYALLLAEFVQFMERCSEILIFCLLPLAHYEGRNSISEHQAVVRYLKTKMYTHAALAPLLELPNAVGGFPAAVLSLCHYKNLSAILYVCYSSSQSFDSTLGAPLLEIMKKSGNDLLTQVETISKLKKKLLKSAVDTSNLYM